ncbi:MAG: aspartate aminotransferase family protein [Sphingomonadales bacterium]|nr:aspartate aminotransferase family protein [Sphingomonadales bacterium]
MRAGNDLSQFWMPFTANRQYKSSPRLLVAAQGNYYTSHDGRQVLDGTAGLWCCNAGHGDPRIVSAIQRQAAVLDYAPSFQMAHPAAFELASRLTRMAPEAVDKIFFCGSGSEAVDGALKIALAYQRAIGQGGRTRLIGRERGYHGVGFGGISVGGIVGNRKQFAALLPGVDHLHHTHDLARNAFTRGLPEHGWELADDLERLVALHDASTIAAVIVEPVAGSTGVLVPPKGYLHRLREICDRHGILLIFDEVITAFGRIGAAFAAERFDVTPDMITTAKAITSGTVPMGAIFARQGLFEAIAQGQPENAIELAHGHTYSAHPLACAAALATLDVYQEDGLFERARGLEKHWEDALHGLSDKPHVVDVRNFGLIGGIELASRPGEPGARAYEMFTRCYEAGVLIRVTGDIIALSPPLTIQADEIDKLINTIAHELAKLA